MYDPESLQQDYDDAPTGFFSGLFVLAIGVLMVGVLVGCIWLSVA